MAVPTLADLIAPLTRERVVSKILGLLSTAGFPVSSWHSTSIPRTLIEAFSSLIVDASSTISTLASLGILELATGDALTLHASDVYDERRKLAVVTKGTRTLVDASGSPSTWSAGELVIVCSADPSLVFRNESAVSLPALGSVAVTFVAESPGQRYNVDGSTVGSLATPVPGVSISPTTGVGWITQSGADEESDISLRARCKAKWATLTTTGAAAAYQKWVLDASSEINRVSVQENPYADQSAGEPAVTVVVASTTGAPTTGALTAAKAAVDARRPLGTLAEVIGAATSPYTVQGVVKCKAAHLAASKALVSDRLTTWFGGEAIEVNGDTIEGLGIGAAIYLSQVIEIIHSAPGVVSVQLTDGSGTPLVPGTDDALLAGNAVATLVTSDALLVWQAV